MTIAIVVTYNPEIDLLTRQYKALLGQVDGVIYVDNHSLSHDFISKIRCEKTEIIKNDDNLGLAKAQNQGIALAQQKRADFVLLFDQDSVPPAGFVAGLMKCYKEEVKQHQVGLVGPAIRNMLINSEENELGVVFKGMSIKRIPLGTATEVSYCIASGSLIPMSVLVDVGGMEEKLFIDGLDLEWCLRAKSKGYKIFQTNNTYLNHCLGNGKSGRIASHSPIREQFITRNSVWMIRQKHIPFGYRLRRLFLALGRFAQTLLGFKIDYIKANLNGIINGIRL